MKDMKQAKVAEVIDQYKVVLNVGAIDGVEVKDQFVIYRLGNNILDPDTGEDLGVYEEVVGRGVVTYVQEKISTLESSEVVDGQPKIIRRKPVSHYALLSSRLFETTVTEEVVPQPEKQKPLKDAMKGDLAKRVG